MGARIAARNIQDGRPQYLQDSIEAAIDAEDYPRLLALANKFAQHFPSDPMGVAWQAMALIGTEKYEDALHAMERASKLGLPEPECHILRAEVCARIGDYTRAAQELAFLVDDPEYSSYARVGRATALLEVGDLAQALHDINLAIRASSDPVAYFTRGDIYRAMGELNECIEDYNRVHEIRPNWIGVLENRAEVYELMGRTDAADADRATIRDATDIDANGSRMAEARELLIYLRKNGVQLTVARNGCDLEIRGTELRSETRATLAKLKPQLLALLHPTED